VENKKLEAVYINADEELASAKFWERLNYYRGRERKIHTEQPIVVLVNALNFGGFALSALKGFEKYFDMEMPSAENPLDEYATPDRTQVFAVLTPKREYFTDVYSGLEFEFTQVVGGDAVMTKTLKISTTIMKDREVHHFDFSTGQEPDLKELAAMVKLLDDPLKEAADARAKLLGNLLKHALGGLYFGLEVRKLRKYARITVLVHKSVRLQMSNAIGSLSRVSFKASTEAARHGIRPASRALLSLCARLRTLKVVVKRAQTEEPEQTRQISAEEVLHIQTEMCQEALGLNVRNMAKVLGVSPRTVYNWNEGNVYFPFFAGRLAAIILVIMAKSSLPTE
jgi:DNA-binding transcriptional regulator YiaG